MASATASIRPFAGAGSVALRVVAIWAWLATIWARVQEFLGLSADWIGNFFVSASSKIPIPPSVTEAFGSVFKTTEAVTSFLFTKLFIAVAVILHKVCKIDITPEHAQFFIIGITMVVLTFQFYQKRYNNLLKIESERLRGAALEAARLANALNTKKRVGATAIGAGIGLALFLGNPLGAAIGGLLGSMFSDSAQTEEVKVEITPVQRLAIRAKALGLSVISSTVYTAILILLTFVPNLDPNYSLKLEGENVTQSSHSASPKTTIIGDIDTPY